MILAASTPTWLGNHVPAALRGIPEVWESELLLSDRARFQRHRPGLHIFRELY